MALIYPGGLTDTDFSDGATGASWQPQNFLYGAKITIPSAGTVTQLGCKCRSDSGGAVAIKFGLYTSGGSLVQQTTGSAPLAALDWVNSGTISASVSAGDYFVLVSAATDVVAYGYDTSGNGSYATEAYATAMQSSETITDGGDTGQLYGVRLDFTASGGGGTAFFVNILMREAIERARRAARGARKWVRSPGGVLVPA